MNKLSNEGSLYLRQHKNNPVHWWTYSAEAFQKAAELKRPVLISIGYSACHWCHVMAHESFENEKIANYLNQNFIAIKVDREELPDVDAFYQQASQITSGRGGWPLNAFTLSNGQPFFIGTYFPAEAKLGLPSFLDVLTEINKNFQDNRAEIENNAETLTKQLLKKPELAQKVDFPGHFPHPSSIMRALAQYQDETNGGYGKSPKFPHFAFLEWAIEQILEGMIPDVQAKQIVLSIENMLMGGIYDHAKGGIHRYAIDEKWQIPHFEKMLYDQAGLLKVLAKVSLILPSPLVFDSLVQTLEYLETEMLNEKKYFMTSQDADSEGQEGLYYVFGLDEFNQAIDELDDKELFDNRDKIIKWFNQSTQGNFEHNLSSIHLNPAFKNEFLSQEGWDLVRKVRHALLENRKFRIPPSTDSKGIASWNFMLGSALVDVIQYCRIDAISSMASKLLNDCLEGIHQAFIRTDKEGMSTIFHSTTLEDHPRYLEDYVFFAEFELRLYELTTNAAFKQNALDALKFIAKDFFKEGFLWNHSVQHTSISISNMPASLFDSSFKSPMATFIGLMRKIRLYEETDLTPFQELLEWATHTGLQHPLAAAELLRALTYPDTAYRKIEIPHRWPKQKDFARFFANFSPRFAMEYHHHEGDKSEFWQICQLTSCEKQGNSLEEFTKIFTPHQNEEEGMS